MDFFNDLGKRFSSVAKSVSEKTRDSVEAGRLSGELKTQKAALEALYRELGKLCYEVHMGADEGDQAEALFERIGNVRSRIEEMTAQRDQLRDVRRCPACGTVMPREARFCYACGKRMPEDGPAPEPPETVEVEYCPACGAQRVAGESACGVCGGSFEPRSTAPAGKKMEFVGFVETEPVSAEEPDEFEEFDLTE